MQWHKCMFKHKKNNSILLCLQGPQADLRLEECTHMGLVNDALKLTFPSNWVNRGKYIAILKFHLYQINIFWKIKKRKMETWCAETLLWGKIRIFKIIIEPRQWKLTNRMLQKSTKPRKIWMSLTKHSTFVYLKIQFELFNWF